MKCIDTSFNKYKSYEKFWRNDIQSKLSCGERRHSLEELTPILPVSRENWEEESSTTMDRFHI